MGKILIENLLKCISDFAKRFQRSAEAQTLPVIDVSPESHVIMHSHGWVLRAHKTLPYQRFLDV